MEQSERLQRCTLTQRGQPCICQLCLELESVADVLFYVRFYNIFRHIPTRTKTKKELLLPLPERGFIAILTYTTLADGMGYNSEIKHFQNKTMLTRKLRFDCNHCWGNLKCKWRRWMTHTSVTVMVPFPQASKLADCVLLQSVTMSACTGENVQEIMI